MTGDAVATPGVGSERLLQVVQDEGRAVLQLVGQTDLVRAVPGCPGWTIADLVAHLTSVYRWVGLIVGERRNDRPSPQERAALDGVECRDQALLAALAMAHAQVVEVLRSAPADLDCWSMWPAANSRHYWIRRQAHETLVHRIDVQNASSGEIAACADVDPAIAADGVDEMVLGFANRYRDRLRAASPCTLSLHATDVDRRWWIRLGPAEPEFGRGPVDGPAPTEIRACSGELLLLLWNRRTWDGMNMTGNGDALQVWRHAARL